MKQAIWSHHVEITSYLVDFQRRLSLTGLLALFQDIAWNHADHLGHGYAVMAGASTAWVLARQRVDVTVWPDWNDRVEIRTWLRPPRGLLVYRDFEVIRAGEQLARGCGTWMAINAETRQPCVAPQLQSASFRAQGHWDFQPMRIDPEPQAESLASFAVRNSDLDLNGHVNNIRYAQWILDSVPLQVHRQHRLKSYEVNFLAEVRADDEIIIQRSQPTRFQGWRESDQKAVFTARLEV